MNEVNLEVFAKSFQSTFGIMNAERVKEVIAKFYKGDNIEDSDESIVVDAYFLINSYMRGLDEAN